MKKTLRLLVLLALLVPSLSFASFDVSLKYGSRGDAVSELQDFLTDQGLYTGKVDGKFGFGMLKAVKSFQTANNLSADGYFGKGSRAVASNLLAVDLKSSDDAEQAETGTVSAPVVLMPGCTDTTGFSVTTGHPCSGSTPSPITDTATQAKLDVLTAQLQQQQNALNQIATNTTPVVVVQTPVISTVPVVTPSTPNVDVPEPKLSLTLNQSFVDQTVSKGTNIKIASFVLTSNIQDGRGSPRIRSMVIGFDPSLQNIYIMINGEIMKVYGASGNNLYRPNITTDFIVPLNGSKTIDVFADTIQSSDLLSPLTLGIADASTTGSGQVVEDRGGIVTGQTITVQ